ncbi:MAG: SpoIIE family protein phosphatase [Phycisphaerales bacterium]|nr:SpoIIE family protein phosphatase [Phycisphaerales bacterium]
MDAQIDRPVEGLAPPQAQPAAAEAGLARALRRLARSVGAGIEIATGAAPPVGEGVMTVGLRSAAGEPRWLVARRETVPMDLAADETLRQILQAFASLADALAEREDQLNHRLAELKAVYQVSGALSGIGDLESILQCALRLAIEVMNVKAGSIRLFNPATDELILRARVNLSDKYFAKGPIFAHESELDTRSLAGEVVYVEDLSTDERIRFPDLVQGEGLCSFLSTGLIFRGKPVGVMRLYTGEIRRFSEYDRNLLRAVAQQVATAIANARLIEEQRSAREVKRQVDLASNVQRRMLPQRVPSIAGLDIAARCIPSLELGGDFYDFVDLGRNLGLSLGDVVGKGVPAALLMASVRASLRAHATDIYDINEIMARTNRALTDDTHEHEFATVWYGVIDVKAMRLTYTNAGHDPPLVFRPDLRHSPGQTFRDLRAGGPVLGIDRTAAYDKGLFDLAPGDVLIVYSDGLTDAQTYDRQRYGRQRLCQAVLQSFELAEQATASLILNHILWDVRRFVGLNPQYDDITLVVTRITGPGQGGP